MIRQRNMGMQVLLAVITVGIYTIYWFYVTSKEMIEYKNLNGSAGLWTVLYLLPWVNIYSWYKQGEAVEALTEGSINRWLMSLLWFVFSPASWFITQTELNKRAIAPSQDRSFADAASSSRLPQQIARGWGRSPPDLIRPDMAARLRGDR